MQILNKEYIVCIMFSLVHFPELWEESNLLFHAQMSYSLFSSSYHTTILTKHEIFKVNFDFVFCTSSLQNCLVYLRDRISILSNLPNSIISNLMYLGCMYVYNLIFLNAQDLIPVRPK